MIIAFAAHPVKNPPADPRRKSTCVAGWAWLSSLRPIGIGLLALSLAGTAAAAVRPRSADDARLKSKAEELAKLRERIEAVNRAIDADRSQQDDLHAAVEAAERKLGEAKQKARSLAAQLDQQAQKLRRAQVEHADAGRRLVAQKTALASALRAAYIADAATGGRPGLLLSQDQADGTGRMLVYYDYLAHARQAAIDARTADIARAAQAEDREQAELAALRDLQAQHREALGSIESDRSERRQAMNEVQTRLADESQELKRLQGSEQDLQKLLESLKRALAAAPPSPRGTKPFTGKSGSMQWPLRGTLLAAYGDPKAGGRLQWKGLWIAAAEGAPVHASAAGRVAYVGRLSSFGLIVVLEHGGGLFTLYGHNASVGKAVGDSVAAGDVIAAAGNSGGYEQPGVYFEVRRGTEPLDPRGWLVR